MFFLERGHLYEDMCQIMLALGEEWIKDKRPSIWDRQQPLSDWVKLYGLKRQYFYGKEGLRTALNKERVITNRVPSNAQISIVMFCLQYIHKYGRDKWLKDMKRCIDPFYPQPRIRFYYWPAKGSKLLKS